MQTVIFKTADFVVHHDQPFPGGVLLCEEFIYLVSHLLVVQIAIVFHNVAHILGHIALAAASKSFPIHSGFNLFVVFFEIRPEFFPIVHEHTRNGKRYLSI